MVKKEIYRKIEIYTCEVCEFGYGKIELAEACENFCKTHKSCSMEITKNAIKR